MSASKDELRVALGMFPCYKDLPETQMDDLYQALLECERTCDAELMDFLKYRMFSLSPAERAGFLTRRQYARLCARVNDASLVRRLEDKAAFFDWFSEHLGREHVVAREGSREAFLDLCARERHLVVKPRKGGYGRGVEVVDTSDANALWVRCLVGECIVEPLLSQHADLARLYPHSVNSVRVVTCVSRQGKATLVSAALRCGRGGSVTDSGNGLFAGVDLSDGRLVTPGVSHFRERFERHPDTGVPFADVTVPNWDALVEHAILVAEENPMLALMNWDWACDANGTWCLMEGNFAGGLGPCQEAFDRGLRPEVESALGIGTEGSHA